MSALVICVRLHDGRYHGQGDWPPSPARLFQALVAGAGLSGLIEPSEREALAWLERQDAPMIFAPSALRARSGVVFYMPNNDGETIGGDPARVAEIRTAEKVYRPSFFDASLPFVYVWPVGQALQDQHHAGVICSLADRLYQLGRGIDMAWAWGDVRSDDQLHELVTAYQGHIYRPKAGNSRIVLACPGEGSLQSIECRYKAQRYRFGYKRSDKPGRVFRQPPRPRFRMVTYDSPPFRRLYELRETTAEGAFSPWPLERVSALVVRLRDGAVERLKCAMPRRLAEIERVLVGRKPDGTNGGPTEDRVRIVPLPSIGHAYADGEIRRVLVEVPPTCPIRAADVDWAFSGLHVFDRTASETSAVLIPASDEKFLEHFGVHDSEQHRVWRTVTPAALLEGSRRWRIDLVHRWGEAKTGGVRTAAQARASAAVHQALRHAGVGVAVEALRLQREPFDAAGSRVEAFAKGTRFEARRLWHIEMTFATPLSGPLVIGDGRFLGLGVMAPRPAVGGIHTFVIESGLIGTPNPIELARALRRAVMARVQAELGENEVLSPFFTGHEVDGTPNRSPNNPHLFFLYVPSTLHLMVLSPHLVERREPNKTERQHLQVLDKALAGFCEVRAGALGCLRLRSTSIDPRTDPLFAVSRVWESVTPYSVTRHLKQGSAREALSADLHVECFRRGLPTPVVSTEKLSGIPGRGLSGLARLVFPVPVQGPLILGRYRHFGGGLFVGKGCS